jgi:Uma2 family endonuclease
MSAPSVRTRRWSRVEYEQLVEKGFFQPGERLELVDGELLVREPQGSRHATGITLVEQALRAAFGSGWLVRVQMPVALDERSEPEPDVSVVPGSPREYRNAHPERPVLVVEVAEASLQFDRGQKASLYARAGLTDFWIVNLVEGVLVVCRQPGRSAEAVAAWGYQSIRALGPAEFVSPLSAPAARILVADLLP